MRASVVVLTWTVDCVMRISIASGALDAGSVLMECIALRQLVWIRILRLRFKCDAGCEFNYMQLWWIATMLARPGALLPACFVGNCVQR